MSAADDLRKELRAEAPATITALDEADVARLAAMLRDARRSQRAAMEQAMDDGLGFVPRVLRGAVKKVIF